MAVSSDGHFLGRWSLLRCPILATEVPAEISIVSIAEVSVKYLAVSVDTVCNSLHLLLDPICWSLKLV